MKTVNIIASGAVLSAVLISACGDDETLQSANAENTGGADAGQDPRDPVKNAASRLIDEGRDTFRNDTFGDEAFWGDTLRLKPSRFFEELPADEIQRDGADPVADATRKQERAKAGLDAIRALLQE